MPIRFEVNNRQTEPSKIYASVGGTNRRVDRVYASVDGVNRLVYARPGMTEEYPILINSAADLKKIEADPGSCYALGSDFQIQGLWFALCADTPFTGTLDGRGHTIRVSGYHNGQYATVSGSYGALSGLIGVNRGTIKNLGLSIDDLGVAQSGGAFENVPSGGVVGINYGTVACCYVSHDGFCGRGLTGAVVGMNKSGGSVSNCHVRGILYHMYGYGGGVAYQNDGRVECCYFYASVTKGVSDNFQEFGSLVHTNTGTLRNIIVASPPTGTFYTFPNWEFWVNNSGTGGGTITHVYSNNSLSAATFKNFDLETIWLFSGGDMKLRAFC